MNPTFAITIAPARSLLRVTLGGFFDLHHVAALEAERHAALARLGCAPNQHVTLVDVSACKLQPQDVVRAFRDAITDPRYMSRRIAVVTGASLARMQVRRLLSRDQAAFFEEADDAEEWLFEDKVVPQRRSAAG